MEGIARIDGAETVRYQQHRTELTWRNARDHVIFCTLQNNAILSTPADDSHSWKHDGHTVTEMNLAGFMASFGSRLDLFPRRHNTDSQRRRASA
jgi:hypothetical protein